MRRLGLGLCLALLVSASVSASTASGAEPGGYIVVLKDSAGDPGAVGAEHANAHGAAVSRVYRHALRGYAARMSSQAAARIAQDPRVAYVDADRPVYALNHDSSQTLPTGVNRIEGDLSSTLANDHAGSVNVAVAVIDTGSGPHS